MPFQHDIRSPVPGTTYASIAEISSRFEGIPVPGDDRLSFGSGFGLKFEPESPALPILNKSAPPTARGISYSRHLFDNDDQDGGGTSLSALTPERRRSVSLLNEEFTPGSSLDKPHPFAFSSSRRVTPRAQAIAAGNNDDEDGELFSILSGISSLNMSLMTVSTAVPMTAL